MEDGGSTIFHEKIEVQILHNDTGYRAVKWMQEANQMDYEGMRCFASIIYKCSRTSPTQKQSTILIKEIKLCRSFKIVRKNIAQVK